MIVALTGNEMLKIFRRKRFRVVVLILVCLTAMIAYGNWRSRRDASSGTAPVTGGRNAAPHRRDAEPAPSRQIPDSTGVDDVRDEPPAVLHGSRLRSQRAHSGLFFRGISSSRRRSSAAAS
jgi:hypothetical protein